MPSNQTMKFRRVQRWCARWVALVVGMAVLLGGARVQAQQVGGGDEPSIPEVLAPWVGWATYGEPNFGCPQGTSGERVCVWPGSLRIDASQEGARFSMRVWLAAPGVVRLPGDATRWPQAVMVGQARAIVQEQDGFPALRLAPGEHRITGEFSWSALPELMPIAAEVGQIALSIDGVSVPRPQLDAQGRLWMNRAASTAGVAQTDSVRASIYRRIEDGIPLTITTRISLNVSGKARKIELGQILLAQSRVIETGGALPVQLDAGGSAAVYSRPGTHEIVVKAVIDSDIAELAPAVPGPDFYDPQEVWIWVPNELARSVELEGLQLVDPGRTSLPQDWHGYRTFLAEPGKTLRFQQVRRGVVESPNAIRVHRQIWLDTDGRGASIRDALSGTLSKDWRLDYAGSATLGHVQSGDSSGGVLITTNPDSGLRGVEVRQAQLDLQADLRLDEFSTIMPALGWNHDVQQLSADLYLPPGWVLFGARGVDEVSGTWVASWTLWDFFFVLMVALSLGKLLGWRWAPLAIITLTLTHGHADAPTWLWFHLIATLALLRVLPDGWWRRGVYLWRVVTLLVLFGVLASFVHDQIRAGLYPQISRNAFLSDAQHSALSSDFSRIYPEGASAPMLEDKLASASVEESEDSGQRGGLARAKFGSYSDYRQLNQVDPKAVVQTGAGVPTWSWNQWTLRWSGPVHKDHEMRLWLLSPAVNRGLTFVRSILLIWLALLLFRRGETRWRKRQGDDESEGRETLRRASFWKPLFHASLILWGFAAVLSQPSVAAAQTSPGASHPVIPGPEVLGELRQRVVAAHRCEGPCVVVSRMAFELEDSSVKMTAEVHAQRDAIWHLPGPADVLQIESVRLDGVPSHQLRRELNGLTQLRVPRGQHRVEVQASLPNVNVATLQFDPSTRPKFVAVNSSDWTVDGIDAQGVPENSLQWTRARDVAGAPEFASGRAAGESTGAQPWFQVDRRIALGLPWKVYTSVSRQDTSRPQMVSIALLSGEKVISDGFRVEKGEILVNFERGVSNILFVGELPIQESLELLAPIGQPWTETWMLQCSRIWACETSGVPPLSLLSEPAQGGEGGAIAQPTWKPWPGEKLSIQVNRPAGADGQSSTVEDVQYRVTPGQRLLQAHLSLRIRASQGGWQTVTLPQGAVLQSASVDGEEQSLRLSDSRVNLPLRPGQHDYALAWQQPWERGFLEQVPKIDIGSEAVNVHIHLNRSEQRWLLWATGPAWGPAILFWSHLVILLLIALFLSRLRGLPLKTPEWILLMLGLSQLPYAALLPIVGWFVILKLRERHRMASWWSFNLYQLGLIFLTLLAAATLYAAIHINLLVDMDMQVQGAQSSERVLKWYVDRSGSALATPAIYSVPILVWRLLMLSWALWLVSRLLRWIPWGWRAFSSGGIWRSRPPRSPGPAAPTAPAAPAAAGTPTEATDSNIRPALRTTQAPSAAQRQAQPSASSAPPRAHTSGASPAAQTPEPEQPSPGIESPAGEDGAIHTERSEEDAGDEDPRE